MAILVMVYGQSGTGKSASLRNFNENDVFIINVSGKPMPFKKKLKMNHTDRYSDVREGLNNIKTPSIVIDDATYLMVNEFMRNAKLTGYQKFTDIAYNFNDLVESAANLPDDRIVYFLGHAEQTDDGREHFKTIGKMLDNYVTLEGKFVIVLKTVVNDGQYMFSTQNSGTDTVKSPMGLFPAQLIPNDLKAVDDAIRAYYGIQKEEREGNNSGRTEDQNSQH